MPENFWLKHGRFIEKYYALIILLFVILTAGSLYYAAGNLGVNSDTSEMFDETLEFRKEKNRFNDLFPLNRANITIVIEAENPDILNSVTQNFADSLKKYDSIFDDVYIPRGGPYFEKTKFLFLPETRVDTLATQLREAHRLFEVLAADYSLKGLLSVLNNALTYADTAQLAALNPLFREMNSTISTQQTGDPYSLSWQKMMQTDSLSGGSGQQFVQVKPQRNFENVLPAKLAIEKARVLANQFEKKYGVAVFLTGRVVMSYEEMQSVMEGTLTAGLLALIMVSITLWIGLRSFRLIVSSLLSLVVGLSLTVGFSAISVGQLNMISVAFAVLYIGLGIDYAIHFTLKFKELRYHDQSLHTALMETFRELSPALTLSTVSTAFAFFAFIPTSFDGVSELGLIAGTGMFISLFITFTLLPALLKLFRSDTMEATEVTLNAPYSYKIAPFLQNNAKLLKILGIMTGIISLFFLPAINFDYNPINLRDADTESVKTMERLMDSGGFSPWSIDIIVPNQEKAEQLQRNLSELKTVKRTITANSFVPDNQISKLTILKPLDSLYSSLPEFSLPSTPPKLRPLYSEIDFFIEQVDFYEDTSPELDSLAKTLRRFTPVIKQENETKQRQYFKKLEYRLLATLPNLLESVKIGLQADTVSQNDLPPSIKDRWISETGAYRVQVIPKDIYDDSNENLRIFAEEVRSLAENPTGNLITAIESGDAVVAAFLEALIYSMLIIALIIFISLRSIKETIYILLPLALSGIMTCAFMVVFDISFNFANIIAIPMIFGLGVDNGIHLVHRARGIDQYNNNMLNTTTARAIFFSSLTTLFSFGNLAFSPHTGTASLGLILSLGLLFMLFATLIVLPAFLVKSSESTN